MTIKAGITVSCQPGWLMASGAPSVAVEVKQCGGRPRWPGYLPGLVFKCNFTNMALQPCQKFCFAVALLRSARDNRWFWSNCNHLSGSGTKLLKPARSGVVFSVFALMIMGVLT